MLRCLTALLGLSFVGLVLLGSGVAEDAPKPAAAKSQKMLRHVVLMQFKADATPEQVAAVEKAFAALPGKIPEIMNFEWGTDVSVENLSQGFTHCFFVTFADAKGREIYLPHPDHLKFVDLVKPLLEKVLVVDYMTK